jgi:hypothetical protein
MRHVLIACPKLSADKEEEVDVINCRIAGKEAELIKIADAGVKLENEISALLKQQYDIVNEFQNNVFKD